MERLPRIPIILSSIRQNRQGEKVARWIHGLASARQDLEVELVDLLDWPLPSYREAKTTIVMENEYTDPMAKEWVDKVRAADAFVVVTPEYNHGYPPSLKNVLDYAYAAWNHKPIGFVSYGGLAGGARAVEQLRLVAVELQMAPIRAAVHIPFIGRAFDEHGQPSDASLASRAQAMLDQLLWWTVALAEGRQAHPVPARAPAKAPEAAAKGG